jgi:molybdate transport system ATP-binding protein
MEGEVSLHVELRMRHGVEVAFAAGAGVTVLYGPSGAGKTSVLDAIAGVRRPEAGRTVLHGRTLFDSAAGVWISAEHRRIGYVPQSLALFPHLTALENVAFGVRERKARRELAREWLERLGIGGFGDAMPDDLSGGERQRVAIARALVRRPDLLLMDEPFSALDDHTKFAAMKDLRRWVEDIPVLLVTHDVGEAFAVGDQAVEIQAGKVLRQGTIEEVLGDHRDQLLVRLRTNR